MDELRSEYEAKELKGFKMYFLYMFYLIVKFFYIVFYFYLFPFLVVITTYFYAFQTFQPALTSESPQFL